MNTKIGKILYHLPVWLVAFTLIFLSATEARHSNNFTFLFVDSLIIVAWFLGSFYIFFGLLVPKYLEKGQFRTFLLSAGLIVFILMPLVEISLVNLAMKYLGPGRDLFDPSPSKEFLYRYLGSVVGTTFCGGLGTFYRFGMDWYNNMQEKKEQENKNLQSELKILKSKLNPHLLFNTLNNIDTLILSDPKKASLMLSKLSDILRYVVYETEQEKIPVQKEVEYLERYVELEKIRLVHPESVNFICQISTDREIPPMLFFPYIENAFKHSNLNDPDQHITIDLQINDKSLSFHCSNTILPNRKKEEHSGLGLELTRKRLDLLFRDSYRLSTAEKDGVFIVELIIQTN